MFGLLRSALTLLICILAVGFYLGWFSFRQSPPDPQSNKVDINVSVDKRKMGTDLQTFEKKVAGEIRDINNQSQGTPQPAGRQQAAPGLNFGPISVQPATPAVPSNNGQPRARLVVRAAFRSARQPTPGTVERSARRPAAGPRANAGFSVHRALGSAAGGRWTVTKIEMRISKSECRDTAERYGNWLTLPK